MTDQRGKPLSFIRVYPPQHSSWPSSFAKNFVSYLSFYTVKKKSYFCHNNKGRKKHDEKRKNENWCTLGFHSNRIFQQPSFPPPSQPQEYTNIKLMMTENTKFKIEIKSSPCLSLERIIAFIKLSLTLFSTMTSLNKYITIYVRYRLIFIYP